MRISRCPTPYVLLLLTLMVGGAPLMGQGSPAGAPPAAVITRARVSKDVASATAVRQVAGGRLQSIGLGMVTGKLAYTAFVTVKDKPGRTTVVVDAMTGAVVSKRP